MTTHTVREKASLTDGGPTWPEDCFLIPLQMRREMDQVLSTAKPRSSLALKPPCSTISAGAELKSQK